MPRYFFHVIDGIEILDREGIHLPDRDAARVHALAKAKALLNSTTPLNSQHGAQVLVVDQLGSAELSVQISPEEVRAAQAKI